MAQVVNSETSMDTEISSTCMQEHQASQMEVPENSAGPGVVVVKAGTQTAGQGHAMEATKDIGVQKREMEPQAANTEWKDALEVDFGKKKKRRNRKKIPFSAMASPTADPVPLAGAGCQEDSSADETSQKENQAGNANLNDFGAKKKKKKKTRAPFSGLTQSNFLKESDTSMNNVAAPEDDDKDDWESSDTSQGLKDGSQTQEEGLKLDFGKKKKASSKQKIVFDEESTKPPEDDLYTYDELLTRLRRCMVEDKLELSEKVRSEKVTIPLPQVIKSGRNRTSFVNFLETANKLHRAPSHLLAYLISELGTTCTICSTNQLWIKGNFKESNIEKVVKKYAKTYVVCPACRSGNTLLRKSDRLTFIVCDTCQAKFSVGKITNGYRARVTIR